MMEAVQQRGLTPRMKDCLAAIVSYQREHGVAPSYDDLRRMLGLAGKSTINRLVTSLEERGRITRLPNKDRSIAVIGESDPASPAYTLPPATQAALQAYCGRRGEDAAAIVADAVALFLDEAELVRS